MSFASEYTGETPLYVFDYLQDEPIAYIVNYDIDGYLRNAVVDHHSNTIIFEIKDGEVLNRSCNAGGEFRTRDLQIMSIALVGEPLEFTK